MLGKLIKYELKATARTLIPLYCALLMFALINKLFIGNGSETNMDVLGGIPVMISMFAYGCTMAAVFIITFFVIVQRFYKNLLGDEGYLMNTLPVPAWMNILSKLTAAIIWSIVSGIVAFLSIMIMAFSQDMFTYFFTDFIRMLTEMFDEFGIGAMSTSIKVIIMLFVSSISGTLMLYLSISIGHLFNKRRILASFGAFIGINIIVNTITGIIQAMGFMSNEIDFSLAMNSLLWGSMTIEIILSIVYFIACNYIMKNKLNLE